MGGNAFKQLSTPRLSFDQYERLRVDTLARLERLFEAVETPIPAPEKITHGDIDFLVHTPNPGVDVHAVGLAVGAYDIIEGHPTSNYAIPFNDAYAQVDVHVCPPEEHSKTVFLHSYGRLGRILTALLRRHGLYFDVKGLFVTKPTKKDPAFLITRDLSAILALVGLSEKTYKAGFETHEELWQWVESGQVNGIPLAHSWNSVSHSENDPGLDNWVKRRARDPSVVIDKASARFWALRAFGLVEEHTSWLQRVQAEQASREQEMMRSKAIADEIRKRLAVFGLTGKSAGVQAKKIRAQVQAEFNASGGVAFMGLQ